MCRPNANLFLFFVIVWHLFFALYEKWGFPAEKRREQEAYNLLRPFYCCCFSLHVSRDSYDQSEIF